MEKNHIDWLTQENDVVTDEGKLVKVFELVVQDDEHILNAWAHHLREHYCSDSDIDSLSSAFGMTHEEYLLKIKFPDKTVPPGPSVRAGDFTEILVADYIEFVLNYVVPRTRYDRKISKNSSPMGSDLIAYKLQDKISPDDELLIVEVKATASNVKPAETPRLQKAVDDSNKDILRLAESLNAMNQTLLDRCRFEEAQCIQRFQNPADYPYKKNYAAAAVQSNKSYSVELLKDLTTAKHEDPDLMLLQIHCKNLMSLIHEMYRRASKC